MNTLTRFDPAALDLNPKGETHPPGGSVTRRKFKELKYGSVVIPYQEYRNGARRYFTLFYYQGGRRIRENRASMAKLKLRAEQVATDIANGETAMSAFTEADRASHLRVLQLLAPLGLSPESAAALLADAFEMLKPKDPAQLSTFRLQAALIEAIKFYLENRPRGFAPQPVPQLVETFLTEKEGEISPGWHDHLAHNLRKLAGFYTGPLHALQASDINTWLRGLKGADGKALGARARHNYRAALDQLTRWAQALGHLPRTWHEMEHVPDPGQKAGEIKILTPEQMTRLITARQQAEKIGRASGTMVPFLALQAFAGLRHEEVHRLDWRDIHLAERYIYISKDVAKRTERDHTGRDRIVPIQDNLAAWLTDYAKRNGPVCPMAQTSGALTKLKRLADIPAGDNETKNVLRKSFISYRKAITKSITQTAEEAGNSPSVIKKYYGRPIPEAEAKRWFTIWPTAAEVLQLNFNLP